MRDLIISSAVVLGFAWLVAIHVAITLGLLSRPPRWRALVGFVVPVLGVYWAFRERMTKRAWLWIAAAAVYVVSLALSSF